MSTFRSIVIFFRLGGVLLAGLARAQVSPPPPASSNEQRSLQGSLLTLIRTKMADNLSRLPNYTCLQTIERSHRGVGKKRFNRQDLVRLEVALVEGRERFAWPGAQRIEETDLSKLLETGVFGSGNFGIFARAIFLTDTAQFDYAGETHFEGRAAIQFRYRVSAGVSDYRIRVNQQEAAVGYHGDFWVDARTLDLLRLQVKADNVPTFLNLDLADNAINYARTQIGGADFLLPRTSEVVMRDLDGNENRNRTSFGQCRQFSGASILSFDDPNLTAAKQAATAGVGPQGEIQLPREFRAEASLETPLDAEETAVGDPVSVRLKDPLKRDGMIVAPKGGVIHGRVVRAEHKGDTYLLRLSFESLDFDSGRADLRGHTIRCTVADAMAPNSRFRGETEEDTMVFASSGLKFPRGFQFSLQGEAAKTEPAKEKPQPSKQEPASLRAAAPAVRTPASESPISAAKTPLQNEPVLRAETVAVVVDVIVTDRKGHHVPGLSASDFELYEDNARQTIVTFTPPPATGKPRRAEAAHSVTSVKSAAQPAAQERSRTPQLITLLVDLGDLHSDSLARACAAASQFINKTIAAGNLISVYWVDSSLHLDAPFTRDKHQALSVIEKLSRRVAAGPFTVYERERAEDELGPKAPDMLRSWISTANALQARTVFVALRAMALAYRDLPGRKTVAVFSEGFRHALDGGASIQAVIDAANRGNVAIYVIDASGLPVSAPDRSDKNNSSVEKATYNRPDSSPDLGSGPCDRVAGGMNQFDWLQTLGSDRHGDLSGIATATGGLLVQDTSDLGSALDRVEDDASEFYTLVYAPSNHIYNGAYRNIKVESARRGYHVRYRRGYWALPPGREATMTPAAAQLLAAIESGERKPSFVPQLTAALVPMAGGFGVAAAVSMPGKLVPFEKLPGQYEAGVSVLLLARDENGGLLAVHEGYGNISLKPQDRDDFHVKDLQLAGARHLAGAAARYHAGDRPLRKWNGRREREKGRGFSRRKRRPPSNRAGACGSSGKLSVQSQSY